MFPFNHKRIIILGSGWSVKAQGVDVDALKNYGRVIGVNDSGILANCNAVMSMDRLWMENRWPILQEKKKLTFLRESAWRKNLKGKGSWSGLILFQNDHESDKLSRNPSIINGFNSGFCAINMAYQSYPEELYIFGFDHCKSPEGRSYWHDPYPWAPAIEGATSKSKYMNWAVKYAQAAQQLKEIGTRVFNVSPFSEIDSFEKITYRRFLDQTKEQRCAS